MGCFLACFGLSKKRKRRKTFYKVLAAAAGDQKHANYEALDSSLTLNLPIAHNSIIPYSNFRDESKEQTRVKSKKKVSFNLNVQIYEPKSTAYQILESDEEEENEKDNGNFEKSSSSSSVLGENSVALNYPSNYRYYNCIDSYNEESDIDEYEDEDEDEDEDDDDEFDEDDGNSDGGEDEDWAEVYDQNTAQKQSSEPKSWRLEEDRMKNDMHSVLSPVENLTQWKAIKAKVATSKHRRKENVPLEHKTSMTLISEPGFNLLESNVLQSKPLLTEIAVDASLSNWLISPIVSKTTIHCQ